MEPNNPQQPQPQPVTQASQQHNHMRFFLALGLLIILTVVGLYGIYSWQHGKVTAADTKNQTLSTKVDQLQKAAVTTTQKTATKPTSSTPASVAVQKQIVTGQVDFDTQNLRGQPGIMFIEALALGSGNLRDIWVDYGSAPDALNLQTEHVTKELGLGDANTYGSFTFTLAKSKLQPGTNYFYQVSAKFADGSIIHGGVAGFTSLK
jgi:hypothetical protein